MNLSIPRMVIAGTASGVGKTTVVAGLIAALRRRGRVVQPFKCGPDYLDPTHLAFAAGRPCFNLDSWMLDDTQVLTAFARGCRGADLAIVEGVMGLFDGSGYENDHASAAQIAKLLGAPVLLVLDIARSARSIAAVVLGFGRFDPAVRIAGVVLNQVGSESHAAGCATAIQRETIVPVLGWLPRDPALGVPERHLGLLPCDEQGAHRRHGALADAVTQRFDLDAIENLARTALPLTIAAETTSVPVITAADAAPLLAVARDEAFSFYYPDNLDLLVEASARITFFSPVRGEHLPAGVSGVYLGGGYPELHGRALAANAALWNDLRDLHARDGLIFAECGGFMVLTEALIDLAGERWPMAGILPGTARMTERLAGFGYRRVTALRDHVLAPAGETLRGHEFHHSVWDVARASFEAHAAWRAEDSRGTPVDPACGFARGNLLASYLHVHLGQNPRLACRIVDHLRRARTESSRRLP